MPLEAHAALGTEGCTFRALTPLSESLVRFSSRRARWKQTLVRETQFLSPRNSSGVGRRMSWNLKKKQEVLKRAKKMRKGATRARMAPIMGRPWPQRHELQLPHCKPGSSHRSLHTPFSPVQNEVKAVYFPAFCKTAHVEHSAWNPEHSTKINPDFKKSALSSAPTGMLRCLDSTEEQRPSTFGGNLRPKSLWD